MIVYKQLQPNSASGSGALEHDPSSIYLRIPVGEAIPGPLPLGVSVIDASVALFGVVFPHVSFKHRWSSFIFIFATFRIIILWFFCFFVLFSCCLFFIHIHYWTAKSLCGMFVLMNPLWLCVWFRLQMLDHFAECIKQAKGVRQQAVQLNIFTAVLSALKVGEVAVYSRKTGVSYFIIQLI